jgi:hypothetical protein
MSKPFVKIKDINQLCKVLGLPKSQAARIEIRRDLVIAIESKIKKKSLPTNRPQKSPE